MCEDEYDEVGNSYGGELPRGLQEVRCQLVVCCDQGNKTQSEAHGHDDGSAAYVEHGPASSLGKDMHQHKQKKHRPCAQEHVHELGPLADLWFRLRIRRGLTTSISLRPVSVTACSEGLCQLSEMVSGGWSSTDTS